MYKYENLSAADIGLIMYLVPKIDDTDPRIIMDMMKDCEPTSDVLKKIAECEGVDWSAELGGVFSDDFALLSEMYVNIILFLTGLFDYINISLNTVHNNSRLSPYLKEKDVFEDFISTLNI